MYLEVPSGAQAATSVREDVCTIQLQTLSASLVKQHQLSTG